MNPYERLAELAELQVEILATGRLEDLAPFREEWEALTGSLPSDPPSTAASHLERARMAAAGMQATLEAGLAAVKEELANLGTGRRAASSYSASVRDAAFENHVVLETHG